MSRLLASDDAVADSTAQSRFRAPPAVVAALGSTLLAFFGMFSRYSPGDPTPLTGMDRLGGQLAWSILLGMSLLLLAWIVRGVVMRRLQWGVMLSLLIHLLLCVTMHVINLRMPLADQTRVAEVPGRPLEEFSLPDYAGQESPDADAAWKRPTDSDTPESPLEVERQKAQVEVRQQPQQIESERTLEVAKLTLPQRQQEIKLPQEQRQEIERQQREREMSSRPPTVLPQVKTESVTEPELDSRVTQSKPKNSTPQATREQADVASADVRLAAAKLVAQRAESTPQVSNSAAVQFQQRSAPAAATQAPPSESVEVSTAPANRVTTPERSFETARQQGATAVMAQRNPLSAPSSNSVAPSVNRVQPHRAASVGVSANSAPTSGGATSLSRNSSASASGSTAAADAAATSVNVAPAGSAGSVQVAESSSASAATRGRAASVPLNAGAVGSGTGPRSTGTSAPTSASRGSLSRPATGGAQPQLGQAAPSGLVGGTGRTTSRVAGAVGSDTSEVAVASTSGSTASQVGGGIADGTSRASVGRSATGIPGAFTGGAIGSASPRGSGSAMGTSGPLRSAVGSGTAVGSTEPSARLADNAGFSGGTGPGLSTGRATLNATLPAGAAEAEQAGALVFSGPQSQPTSVKGLDGPQIASVPRRSAGLPGVSGGASATTPGSSGAPQPTRLSGGPARPGTSNARPQLAASGQIAELFKKSVPGLSAAAESPISASLSMRNNDSRREAIQALGGSTESEEAVERGLKWLAAHQHPDGHWSIHDFKCQDHQCSGHGSFRSDTAATGLALLAFLGAGYTHQTGLHQTVVDRGLKWHLKNQKANGDLFADESDFVWFYSHGMAAIALCEAFGLTKDAALRDPAQKALDFIVQSQHPEFGGWRYRPRFESDTSVSGWQLMALKSGEMAGLQVPKTAYAGVTRWLDSVESKSSPGQFAYHPSKPTSLAMTAEGLLMRQYLGAKRNDAKLVAGANVLRRALPDLAVRDAYYWYYATQVMFHMQGEYWDEWNARLRDTLVSTQLKDGGSGGSWNPDRPTTEKWGAAGGRHYLTCLNLLMLEVYYRHLPLYLELEK
jgi:hypothetical protein